MIDFSRFTTNEIMTVLRNLPDWRDYSINDEIVVFPPPTLYKPGAPVEVRYYKFKRGDRGWHFHDTVGTSREE
jgi:hypothetical protein